MESVEYTFRIDAFTPETLPMARLADYLTALAKLMGSPEHTHLLRIEAGSARLVHKIDAVDAPKVANRLREIVDGTAGKDILAAFARLDDLLANDNAVGQLMENNGRVVIPFPGRERPKPLSFPSFRQDGSIEGQVVSVGGKDATAHVILQDGDMSYSNLEIKRELARELAKHLWGAKVRLTGNGRWERQATGAWKLLHFRVDHYEVLDQRPLQDVLTDVRNVPDNGLMERSAYWDLLGLRSNDGAVH